MDSPQESGIVIKQQLDALDFSTGYGIDNGSLYSYATAPSELITHTSKGYTIDYNINAPSPPGLGKGFRVTTKITPPLRDLLNLVLDDPVALSAINKVVDRVMENGWFVRGRDLKSKNTAAMQKLKDLHFNPVMRRLLFHLILYNNAFLELVKTGQDITELNVLEPTLMRISATNFGDLIGYWQNVILPDKRGNPGFDLTGYPTWEPEEVIHYKQNQLTTRLWGDVDLVALERNLKIKAAIKRFVHWLFETNQFRGFFTFNQGASDDQIKEFLSYYRLMQGDLTKPLTARGDDIGYQLIRKFDDAESMLAWLRAMDSETLQLLQVPEMIAGRQDSGANRSTGDTAVQNFNTRINSLQEYVGDINTYQLLPALGFNKVDFVFEPVDRKDVKDLMAIAEQMINMKIKPEYVEKWMKQNGFDLGDKEESIFYTPEELMAMQVDPNQQNLTGSPDQYKSRKGKVDARDSSKRIGTGSAGTTRQDQLVTHSKSWYYDAIVEE